MAITRVTNHIDQGLARLLSRFKNKPRFAAWCASHLRQAQLFEDACWELADALDVDTTDRRRLDLLGKIVGQPAKGTDDEMRRYVKVRILVNRTHATAPNLIKIATILFGVVDFRQVPLASIVIEIDDPFTGSLERLEYSLTLLRAAKGAGVNLKLVFADADGLQLAAGTAYLDDPSHGLAPTTLSYGGALSAVR